MPDSRLLMMPYTFRVEGIAKGCRKPETHYFRDTIPVRVPLLGSAEVPLTLDLGADQQGRRIIRRAFGGYPVREVAAPLAGYFGKAEPFADMAAFDAALAGATNPPPGNFYWPSYPLNRERGDKGQFPAYTTRGEVTFREIVKDREEQDRTTAERQARHLVFVDGHLHALAEEPRWKIEKRWSGNNVTGYVIRLYSGTDSGDGETFAIDRKDDALRLARHVAGRLPVTSGADPMDNGLIEWKTDHSRVSAKRLLRNGIMPSLQGADATPRLPRGFFEGYCDLRDLHDARQLDRDTVIGPARAMLAALAAPHPAAAGLAGRLHDRIGRTLWRMEEIEIPRAAPASEPEAENGDEETIAMAFD